MKKVLWILGIFSLVGCATSGDKAMSRKTSSTAMHQCVARQGGSCAQEIAMVCPKGFVDGCSTGATRTHQCVSREFSSCAQEVSMICPAGFVDGCEDNSTRNHQCVPRKGTTSCALEMMMVCPPGFIDSCNAREGEVDDNPQGFVCQSGWVNCMPIVAESRRKYCTKEYADWAEKNCGGRPRITH